MLGHRDGIPWQTDRVHQMHALADLRLFLRDKPTLPHIPFTISGRPTPVAWADLALTAGLDEVGLLQTMHAYATALGERVQFRRVGPMEQEHYCQANVTRGQLSIRVFARFTIDCLFEPPTSRTPKALMAERDWHAEALVELVEDVECGNGYDEDTVHTYRAGEQLRVWQRGPARRPIQVDWWTGWDLQGAHLLPARSVRVLEQRDYQCPFRDWPVDELDRAQPVAVASDGNTG